MLHNNGEQRPSLTLADCEELLADTMIHVAEIHSMTADHGKIVNTIPTLHTMLTSLVTQFGLMVGSLNGMKDAALIQAEASKSMAETFRQGEARQERLESETIGAKDQTIQVATNSGIPPDLFKTMIKWIALGIGLPMCVTLGAGIFLVLWFTNTNFKASARDKSIEITQRQTDKNSEKIEKLESNKEPIKIQEPVRVTVEK